MAVWAMMIEMVHEGLPEFKDVIINPTIREGHLIFTWNPKFRKTIQKVTLNLGIKADHLTNTVRIIAPGKFVAHLPKGDLLEITYTFCPTNPSTKEPLYLQKGIYPRKRRKNVFLPKINVHLLK